MSKSQALLTEASTELFGCLLRKDNYGFYVGVEFFALLAGNWRGDRDPFLPTAADYPVLNITRRSHDFARRVAWPDETSPIEPAKVFTDSELQFALISNLLASLQVPVPGRRKASLWSNSHFLPYGKDLSHWDCTRRGSKYKVENICFRGAGTYCFKIIRNDNDLVRLNRVREGLQKLLEASTGKLEALLRAFAAHDEAATSHDREEKLEAEQKLFHDKFEDQIRDGVESILSHSDLPRTLLIDALLRFLPFSLCRLQHWRALKSLERDTRRSFPVVVDFGTGGSQLRRESKKSVQCAYRDIEGAASSCGIQGLERSGPKDLSAFYTRSAAAIGFLNAPTGIRHHVISDSLLEALVLSQTKSKQEISLGQFLEGLYEKWGLVISREAAQEAGLLERHDSAVFEDNLEGLVRQMRQLGFLHEFSDMTKMVRYAF